MALTPAAAPAHLQEALLACRALVPDAERLSCYDGIASAETRPAQRAASSADAAVAPVSARGEDAAAAQEAVASATFGAERLPAQEREQDRPAQRLAATITHVLALPRGNFRLTLDNGQVWQEIRYDRSTRYAVGDGVEIRRGTLGSYNLASEATGRRAKVRRIR